MKKSENTEINERVKTKEWINLPNNIFIDQKEPLARGKQ